MHHQDSSDVYFKSAYRSPERFASYAHQIDAVLQYEPNRVLEVGIGAGIVACLLRHFGVNLTTVDIDADLHPDVVASVTDLPFPDDTFDVAACFETLEHLPWSAFDAALGELRRVAARYVALSIPDARRLCRVALKAPVLPDVAVDFHLPIHRAKPHAFDGYHYWEINKKGTPLAEVTRRMVDAGLALEHTYRPRENPYHRMFLLKKVPA